MPREPFIVTDGMRRYLAAFDRYLLAPRAEPAARARKDMTRELANLRGESKLRDDLDAEIAGRRMTG